MNFFYVLNGKKIKQYSILVIALLFAAGIIYSEKGNISVFAQKEPAAIYNVPTSNKMIALTFDISWGDKRAEPIIDVLKAKGVQKATFFLSSPWSKTHPNLVQKIQSAGFEIGSHGHKHTNYSKLQDEQIRNELQTSQSILAELTGETPTLLRLPNGDFDKRVLQIAEELNYTVIQWGTDSQDWKNKGVNQIVDRVISKAHPGDIILLHASDTVTQTHEALPLIIDQLKSQGYEFVTVSEMLEQSTTTEEPVKDSSNML